MEKILLFIPMYNCEKQITRVLDQIKNLEKKFLTEVIVINDRSKDDGENAVINYLKNNEFQIKISVLRNDLNYGLGGVHKVAFDYAINHDFDYAVILHGDDQGRIKDLVPVINSGIYREYDCLLGSRFMRDSKILGYSKFRTFGNIVYNMIFSVFLFKNIKDLGAGLNMYKVDTLKSKFYYKYPDNLTFNCYMLEAAKCYKHRIKFFPITWSEDDQVSNVKMFRQAINTLKMLFQYFFFRKKFLEREHRSKVIEKYSSELIFTNEGK